MQNKSAVVSRASRRLAWLAALFVIGATPACAEDGDLKQGAKKAGRTAGTVIHEVGEGVKKAGKEIGKGAKEAGKAIGEAAKEGGKEFKRAVKGED